MIGSIVAVGVLLGIGLMLCYLLRTRNGPFAPYTSTSIALGLDQAVPIQTSAAASLTLAVKAPAPSSQVATSAPPLQPAPISAPTYTSAVGADMTGNDMQVTGDDGKTSTSQGVYGPSGCTAVCSANAGCQASVYQPSTKTCWIKSGVDSKGIQANSDRILSAVSSAKGGEWLNSSFGGQENLSIILPDSDQCKLLCNILPYKTCAGTSYNTNTKTCSIKNPANNMQDAPMTMSYLRTS